MRFIFLIWLGKTAERRLHAQLCGESSHSCAENLRTAVWKTFTHQVFRFWKCGAQKLITASDWWNRLTSDLKLGSSFRFGRDNELCRESLHSCAKNLRKVVRRIFAQLCGESSHNRFSHFASEVHQKQCTMPPSGHKLGLIIQKEVTIEPATITQHFQWGGGHDGLTGISAQFKACNTGT